MSIAQRCIVTIGCMGMLFGVSVSANAQDKIGLTLAAGTTFNADPPPAEDFTEPFYLFSVQSVIKKYFVLDGDVSYWTHTSRQEFGPHPITGPNGVIGFVQGGEVVDTNKDLILGLNFLVRSAGRIRVFGGAGAAMVFESSDYQQQEFGCSTSLDPRTCMRFVNQRTSGPLPLFRLLGGVEFLVTDRVGIVGAVRRDALRWEDSKTNIAVTAGVRFGFP